MRFFFMEFFSVPSIQRKFMAYGTFFFIVDSIFVFLCLVLILAVPMYTFIKWIYFNVKLLYEITFHLPFAYLEVQRSFFPQVRCRHCCFCDNNYLVPLIRFSIKCDWSIHWYRYQLKYILLQSKWNQHFELKTFSYLLIHFKWYCRLRSVRG